MVWLVWADGLWHFGSGTEKGTRLEHNADTTQDKLRKDSKTTIRSQRTSDGSQRTSEEGSHHRIWGKAEDLKI